LGGRSAGKEHMTKNDAISQERWVEQNDQFGGWPEKGKEYHFAASEENWPAQKKIAAFFYITFPLGLLAAYFCFRYPENEWIIAFTQVGGIGAIALDVVLILYGMIAIYQWSEWLKRNPDIVIIPSRAFGHKQFIITVIFWAIVLFVAWICGEN
jgi:hypothetical protein